MFFTIDVKEFIDPLININFHSDSNFVSQLLKRNRRSFTTDQTKYQQQMLKSHNTYRARHCAPSLQLDNALSRSAQDYANKLARMNQMVHSRTPNVGENLWMMSSSAKLNNIDGSTATTNWYDEVKKYNFNRPGFSMGTGHFTQVVWKATQRLGVGFAFTSDRKGVYVVAQYSPAGNFQGQFPNNVLLGRC
uniref:Cysteine-rich secretory protein-2-like protein n=1 Tax=Adineta vaga TaxID=104782 RepID=B3G471_ADIVA|nr:cysteine-rich secretory protein-2-like protein [Adineta vaga]